MRLNEFAAKYGTDYTIVREASFRIRDIYHRGAGLNFDEAKLKKAVADELASRILVTASKHKKLLAQREALFKR